MPRKVAPLLAGAVAAAVALAVAPMPATANARPADPGEPTAAAGTGLAPGMLPALRRDLGMDDARLRTRLRVEAAAPVLERNLRDRLGATFAGAWFTPDSDELTVAVTEPRDAATVRAAGARPQLVPHGERHLAETKAALDRVAATAGGHVQGWYVDVASNTVTVLAHPNAATAAKAFVAASGADTGAVRVVTSVDTPRLLHDIRGGDQYVVDGKYPCSVGFAVNGGFVTAGHCGPVGSTTVGHNGVAQGTFRGSSFPGNDYAWVQTNGDWTPRPWVNNYAGGVVTVAGSQEAAIGSSVCRSGRTTGWRCGTIQARDQTVNYAEGTVYGLTRTTACAEGGDSGGAWLAGDQAQGITSGGSGNCSSGGTTYYQPLNEILSAYGLSLVTSGGGGGNRTRIVSSWNNRCIDVPNRNFADGQRLAVWDCHDGSHQKWEWVNGTLRTDNNKCMDVAWGSNTNGTAIQIVSCNGHPAQQFVLSQAGDLVNPQTNKCVDVKDWNNANGALLQLWDCAGTANQKWRRG